MSAKIVTECPRCHVLLDAYDIVAVQLDDEPQQPSGVQRDAERIAAARRAPP